MHDAKYDNVTYHCAKKSLKTNKIVKTLYIYVCLLMIWLSKILEGLRGGVYWSKYGIESDEQIACHDQDSYIAGSRAELHNFFFAGLLKTPSLKYCSACALVSNMPNNNSDWPVSKYSVTLGRHAAPCVSRHCAVSRCVKPRCTEA